VDSGRVWFVTGAARGLGASIVEAALAAGHRVVATARRPDAVTERFGAHLRLVPVALDVTSPESAEAAVATAMEQVGRIDVVVNNAGASYKGYFEEMSSAQVAEQLAVNLLGPMNVTRAVLPVLRQQRSGLLVMVSSGAGLVGFEYSSVYAASKAGLEGWTSALEQEVAPFGIRTMLVNPGFFRTGLAGPESLVWPERTVDDYADRSARQQEWWRAQDGQQPGDPDALARLLVSIAGEQSPTRRLLAGDDAIALAEQRSAELAAQAHENRLKAYDLGFRDAASEHTAPVPAPEPTVPTPAPTLGDDIVLDDVGRPEPPVAAPEIETLLGFLDFQRATLAWKCEGLDEQGLRQRIAPSSLRLAALLKHMAWVEDHWFSYWLCGNERVEPWRSVDVTVHRDWEITSADTDTAEGLWALWSEAVERSRSIVGSALAAGGLDTVPARRWDDGRTPSLRWIIVHMIEEYARHNGHADFLREAVDGSTGE